MRRLHVLRRGLIDKYRLSDHVPLTKAVELQANDVLKIVLTATEDGKPKRPNQAFLLLRDQDTGLEATFPFTVKESGKGKVDLVSSFSLSIPDSCTTLPFYTYFPRCRLNACTNELRNRLKKTSRLLSFSPANLCAQLSCSHLLANPTPSRTTFLTLPSSLIQPQRKSNMRSH